VRRDEGYSPPLQVVGFIATRKGDEDRGPVVYMNSDEARLRLMQHGELVWVYGPRRHELVELRIDDELERGEAVLRDVAGASPTEIIRVIKVDTDTPRRDNLA
jgi:anaerobic selenocysteine-containing dehydrogenase